MKKLIIILFAAGFALSASAQKFRGGRPHYGRPRVVISTGVYSPLYPYGYYSGYPFYPYPYGYYAERPIRLELKIEDIQNDYKDRIWSARHDKSLPRKERKATIHRLKHERDEAIIQAKRDYYKRK